MNLWLASNADTYARIAAGLPELAGQPRETMIMEHGTVMDSYISAGAEIDGYVKNSVIFPNVVVRRDARIVNSVIATNHRIGAEATIMNSLILPFEAEDQRNPVTLGAHCLIGGRSSDIRNACFPSQIRDGLTVVGMNVMIPNGFRAEAASFIGPGASLSGLRRRKVLRKGGCHFSDGREVKTEKNLGRG